MNRSVQFLTKINRLKQSRNILVTGVIQQPPLTSDRFSALILMAFATTLMAPITLKWSIMRLCLPEGGNFCRLLDKSSRP